MPSEEELVAAKWGRTLWHVIHGEETACGRELRKKHRDYKTKSLAEVPKGHACFQCTDSLFVRDVKNAKMYAIIKQKMDEVSANRGEGER